MSFSIHPVSEISKEQISEFAGRERFITHAHNPCLVGILNETFGWQGSSFVIKSDEVAIGIFSCMYINGRVVSMPHFSYGGLMTSFPDRKEIYEQILPQIHYFFSGKSSVEQPYLVRDGSRIGNWVVDSKVISWIDIANKTLVEAIPPAQMTKARKAESSGLTAEYGGINLLADFYSVYSRNMLRLGSPVLPLKLFKNILEGYRDGKALIVCVYKEKKPIGAGFLMSYAGFYENTWFSTLNTYNYLFPAQLLHHEMIQIAIRDGGHTYSFGRSTAGSGVHEFKRRWSTVETVIYWNYDQAIKTDFRKAEFLSHLWKYLPLQVANRLGPLVSGRIY